MNSQVNQFDILNIACGKNKIEGALNVDIDPSVNPDIIYDLNEIPFRFAEDNQFRKIYFYYTLEHLNMQNKEKIFDELFRISKDRTRIYIKVCHKSGTAIWDNPNHKIPFTCGFFKHYHNNDSRFYIRDIKLNYFVKDRDPRLWYKIVNKFVSFFANFLGWYSIRFCERVWCYWVGGFDEIYVEFEVVK